ncbi:hypothetical protein RFM26_05475 [Mesorhizobium sp. VK23B]|uniref:Major facilitator superfamily (MFS) profile domain-containing protein n=1 Tax=Mesorhizobium dulcispinae TaxID=3072316 RepID=A0ABU4XCY7_9HYPH|nr:MULTISPECIES: hypothetical protein [unclassified Mesorhizobium]MDX8465130.1 hypothetical protein [Mesorhizobium sp. VK23B]MDX8472652.1 hypothetical protein [Mesorhizobium sp. VK23A]
MLRDALIPAALMPNASRVHGFDIGWSCSTGQHALMQTITASMLTTLLTILHLPQGGRRILFGFIVLFVTVDHRGPVGSDLFGRARDATLSRPVMRCWRAAGTL